MLEENRDIDTKAERSFVVKLLAFIGVCCLLQFFIVSPAGLVRSASAEKVSDFVYIVGFVLILPYYPRPKRSNICLFFLLLMMIYTSLVSLGHGYHFRKGDLYFYQGQYREALESFKKETQLWYLRLRYNHEGKKALEMMAETYCQLEDFDSARNTYNLMIERYSDEYYGGVAQRSLEKLEKGLKAVAYYPDRIAEMPIPDHLWKLKVHLDPKQTEVEALLDIARTYIFDLNCHAKAFEVYTRIIDMDISENSKEYAKGQILQLRVKQ